MTATLKRAGADNVAFNAPLGSARAAELADELVARWVTRVVDLGCGRGELARLITCRSEMATVVGVENDPYWVGRARESTSAAGLGDRVTIELADASAWAGDVDAAVAVGVSHAFGGFYPMLTWLATWLGEDLVLIGEGVWESDPGDWCRETFGDVPRGLDGIEEVAASAGWSVEHSELSTLPEWDEFEHGWIAGVRSVGSAEARSFADQREAGYQRYRGVLGFAWLRLRRA